MNPSQDKNFIQSYGTMIIAIVALIQPWIIALWKKLYRKSQIHFEEIGNIEIGFNSFASNIGLNGMLRSSNKDFYISRMFINLKKIKDSSEHQFEWNLFRDVKFSLDNENITQFELPYGLNIQPQEPKKVSIQFKDSSQVEYLLGPYNSLSNEWLDFFEEKKELLTEEEIYEEFKNKPVLVNNYTKINREFYWEAGKYEMTLNIQTAPSDKITKIKYTFSLTEEQCDSLRLNTVKLCELACNQEIGLWNFAYVAYEKQ